jgi:hypothetical protein
MTLNRGAAPIPLEGRLPIAPPYVFPMTCICVQRVVLTRDPQLIPSFHPSQLLRYQGVCLCRLEAGCPRPHANEHHRDNAPSRGPQEPSFGPGHLPEAGERGLGVSQKNQ